MHTSAAIPVSAPTGDVTLMFTDIEGSTRAWDTYKEAFREVLDRHNVLMRECIARYDGFEVKTVGDSFVVAFADRVAAIRCAIEMQRKIESAIFDGIGGIRVRIGLHAGELEPYAGDYFGPIVNHTARIESAGHGGQVVLSEELALSVRAGLPEGASLIDVGLHRLKDLGAPIRLYLLSHQDLPDREYPPLRTLNMLPHNFPAQVTSFVGREREQKELRALLTREKRRLVTLTGPGGTGKTRLSMQVAAEAIQDFKDGIWLVELAGVTDAREVPAAIALALRIPIVGDAGIPAQVFSYLQEKTVLLVIDNFEQVVGAAKFVGELLKQCRGVSCLVTSQHLLQIAGESEYPLSPLDLPASGASLADSLHNPTVQLFAERAHAAKPTFTLNEQNVSDVVEICRRLEGLPLAIELTAALVRALAPQQILPRLKDRFKLLASTRRDLDPRQQSLRGALDWSYELLSEEEKIFFAQISVFAGGFYLEDVEAVCPDSDGFMLAVTLRDKSLLRTEEVQGETRYLLLETIRGYAADRLEQSGDAESMRECHANWFLKRAKEWSAALNSPGEAMQRMIRDIDNLRAGMDWACERDCDELIVAYGLALSVFFRARGLYEEGDRRLAVAEQSARKIEDQRALARILQMRGRLASNSSRFESAQELYKSSLQISEEIGDRDRVVASLINLGGIALILKKNDQARDDWEKALSLARDTRQSQYEATALANLGSLALVIGDYHEALNYIQRGLALHEQQGNRNSIAYALLNYGEVLEQLQQPREALQRFGRARELFEEVGDRFGLTRALLETSKAHVTCGENLLAAPLIEEGLALARETQSVENEAWFLLLESHVWWAKGSADRSKVAFEQAGAKAIERRDFAQISALLRLHAWMQEPPDSRTGSTLPPTIWGPVEAETDTLVAQLKALLTPATDWS